MASSFSWSAEVPVGEIQVGKGKAKVSLTQAKNGEWYLNLRIWYRDVLGEWKPGKQGFSLQYEDASQVVDLLDAGVQQMEDL